MAITTASLAASYFVLDVPDVRWTEVPAGYIVRVTITPQNGASVELSETYIPDSDGTVTLRGLSELIEPYVRPCPTPLRQDLVTGSGVWLATVVRASFTVQLFDVEGNLITPTFHSYAYYASRRTKSRPGATTIWLTRYTERTILSVQPICLSVLLMDTLSAQMVVEGLIDGVLQTVTVPVDLSAGNGASSGTAPAYAAVVHYTVAELATAAGMTQVLRATAQLLESGTVVDSVTFHIDYTHKAQRRVVAFTNCFGMMETEAFTGTDEVSTEMEADYAWLDRGYEKTATREVTAHRLAARFTGKTRRDSLRDIMVSPEVYLIHEDGADCWQKMTVTGFELTDEIPHTAPQTAFLTLRQADMHQEEVSRAGDTDDGQTRHRIFDYTFDPTFN